MLKEMEMIKLSKYHTGTLFIIEVKQCDSTQYFYVHKDALESGNNPLFKQWFMLHERQKVLLVGPSKDSKQKQL